MRVLFVSDVYFPRVNGVSTSIATFRADLNGAGVDTTLVTPQYGVTSSASDDAGIRRVPSRPVPRDPEDRLMRWGALGRTLHALQDQRYDLVHIHTPFLAHYAGVRFARAAGLPVVETYHTFFEEYVHHYVPLLPRAVGRHLARSITRSQCKQVDALVAPSAPMRDMLESIGVRTPVTVIPTGLPADRFLRGDAARFRAGQAIPPGRALVLYVGRVAHEKNIGFLVDSFVEVRRARPDALLVIAGEGPARAALMAQVERLGLARDVAFVGYLDRASALADCYAAAAVFVFASRTETQGLVLLEAMAQGCPVVSTAHLGTASILQSGCGARVVPEERSAFAQAVIDTLADPRSAALAGAQARAYAQRWASEQMAQRMREFYAAQLSPAKIPQPAISQVILRETHERRS
jgi:glycosyltransferase involved in cell wall biosynthesis